MYYINYEIEFFSPWHCGSGQGGGNDADYCPVRDVDGFPFVPGKTVKGLFRDAAATLFDADFVAKIFGVSSRKNGSESQEGLAIWSDARLSTETRKKILKEKLANELYISQYFIKIDDAGQAEDKALRNGEYAVPVKLYGKIENLSEDDVKMLSDCTGFIKHLGLQRSRGFGRCRITIKESGTFVTDTAFKFTRKDTYSFKCKFLAPIVLNSTGATEGNLNTLEYIPGSNFLGIVGKDYTSFGNNAFDVFHSGKVRFGNAYPLENNKNLALPCPATWYIAKGQSLTTEVEIFADSASREKNRQQLQPKQVRGGYFVPAKTPRLLGGKISKTFSLKSAYDSENRKSRDKELYGYSALNEGTEWAFNIKIDPAVSDDVVEKIVKSLLGRHQIGRSRNSQYGSVEISLLDSDPLHDLPQAQNIQRHYFYAASSLAFLDPYGEPTLLPQVTDLGFSGEAKLDMIETQIRYHVYCPWNGARKSRDAERLVILPGSVIVVCSAEKPDLSLLKKGIGLYKSEGFGEVIYNPQFLFCKKLEAADRMHETVVKTDNPADQKLIDWLVMQQKKKEKIRKIYKAVQDFRCDYGKDYSSISASQWGAIRAKAANAESVDALCNQLFEEEEKTTEPPSYEDYIKNGKKVHHDHPGYLRHGTAVKQWKPKAVEQLKDMIEKMKKDYGEEFTLTFLQLLCAEMAKGARKGGRK